MTTIRKTISISKKDRKLQEIIENVPNYEVSHLIRQLMYDGLKYRALVEQGLINDINVGISVNNVENMQKIEKIEQKPHIIEEKEPKIAKKEQKSVEIDDFDEEFDINSVKLEEIEENDEDLEDILLKNS